MNERDEAFIKKLLLDMAERVDAKTERYVESRLEYFRDALGGFIVVGLCGNCGGFVVALRHETGQRGAFDKGAHCHNCGAEPKPLAMQERRKGAGMIAYVTASGLTDAQGRPLDPEAKP